jgi:UDP-N-acetylglucosamine--N-acetylmuramyl-(pentapeptide) pyrophosphoryl-undecaprenol N-acetylglucosamine transferase
MWGDKSVSAEYQEITARGIPFYNLKAGKLYKTFHPLKLLRLPFGFLQAFYYLLRIRPQLIVSFGGYLAPPVVISGWLLRIPSVTHEQTVEGGWANRLVARFAKKVFVTWEESLKYFPKEKTIVTGNPLRPAIFESRQQFNNETMKQLPTIYITGGKQGSHIINVVAGHALPHLLEKYNIIHQCGRSSVYNDYQELKEISSDGGEISSEMRSRYILKDYFTEDEIGAVFAAADLVISRAGANIVYELAALGKPAILIPLPWVSHDEQHKNAQILVDTGSAVILEEKDLTPDSLTVRTVELFENIEKFREGGKRAQKLVRLDAAERMAEEIVKLVG